MEGLTPYRAERDRVDHAGRARRSGGSSRSLAAVYGFRPILAFLYAESPVPPELDLAT